MNYLVDLIYILIPLKVLTAYKVDRPDLIMTPSAFEASIKKRI